ncbi:MAG TPA: DUF2993 domain-containing protein [Streptosporangiaceae bacterium]
MSGYQAADVPAVARRRRRRRPLRALLITVVVVLGLLVAADFTARAIAQDRLAAQIRSHGFPKKPQVSIHGFPFLTQLAARKFGLVTISSHDVAEGQVQVSSIKAALHHVTVSSGYSGGTVSRLSGSALITFPELARALVSRVGALGAVVGDAGLQLSRASSSEVRARINLVITSASAVWRITEHPGSMSAVLVTSSGLPPELLDSIRTITVPLPSLPLGLTIRAITVTPSGLTGSLAGRNLSFGS